MIPSNFRIEILTIRALLCAIGSKGLKCEGRAIRGENEGKRQQPQARIGKTEGFPNKLNSSKRD